MLWLASIGIGAALVPVLISWLGLDRRSSPSGRSFRSRCSCSAARWPESTPRLRHPRPGAPDPRVGPDLRAASRGLARACGGAARPAATRTGHGHRPRRRRRRPLLHRGRGRDRGLAIRRAITELDGWRLLRRDRTPSRRPAYRDRHGSNERRALRTRPRRLPRGGHRTSAERRGGGDGHGRAPLRDLRRPAIARLRHSDGRAQRDRRSARRIPHGGCRGRRGALLRDPGHDAVFLGTAPGERWTGESLRTSCTPTSHAARDGATCRRRRSVDIAADGRTAWFDETVENAAYGACRGSGVLAARRRWRIAQYNLTIPVPDELAPELVTKIRELA